MRVRRLLRLLLVLLLVRWTRFPQPELPLKGVRQSRFVGHCTAASGIRALARPTRLRLLRRLLLLLAVMRLWGRGGVPSSVAPVLELAV